MVRNGTKVPDVAEMRLLIGSSPFFGHSTTDGWCAASSEFVGDKMILGYNLLVELSSDLSSV